MKHFYKILISALFIIQMSCADYLDIVPDNIATIDYAFRMRATAEQYLSTCYSSLPSHANPFSVPGFFGADEWWHTDYYKGQYNTWEIARGNQNKNNPLADFWRGANGGHSLWRGISECNIFLENIVNVPDMEEEEIDKWVAEVKFLKAYYFFYLLRHYGPIPIIKENLPVSASGEEVRVYREPVDDVFEYIIELIDEALLDLPDLVEDENSELGRITLPIALGMKAKILVYAASPLFNGNTDYRDFKDHNGNHFFNQIYSEEKWEKAVRACKEAIDFAHSLGIELYKFEDTAYTKDTSPETKQKLTIRGIVAEKWNSEIIWANTNSLANALQRHSHSRNLHKDALGWGPTGHWGTTLKAAALFYSENGVPIEEDIQWSYSERFDLREATHEERFHIKEGYTTAKFNFNREPRFYGSLAFDGAIWYGHGEYDDEKAYHLQQKRGQIAGKTSPTWHPAAGYYPKKLDYYTNIEKDRTTYSMTEYAWPILRLGDLYLLYAEALNELNGPQEEAFEYLDAIRARAGLKGVKESWTNYSTNPNKYTTKDGLREIIMAERTAEMMFEAQRFYDLRRWKTAPIELNKPITGWDVNSSKAEDYYRETILDDQVFEFKDYFWPIREYDIIVNKNLVQNPGW